MSIKSATNYCALTHFDAYQCVVSHLPHLPDWLIISVEVAFWALVILFVLSLIERVKNLVVMIWMIGKWLLDPGVQLLKDVYAWIKNKVK